MEMEVLSSASSLLGAASSLQSVTVFLQNGLCHPCRALKDTGAVCSDSNWAKMPAERCVLWAKCFSLWDWFRCVTGVLSLAHIDFTLTLLTGLLLVYPVWWESSWPKPSSESVGFQKCHLASKQAVWEFSSGFYFQPWWPKTGTHHGRMQQAALALSPCSADGMLCMWPPVLWVTGDPWFLGMPCPSRQRQTCQ